MEAQEVSLVKFLGYKRKSKRPIIETPIKIKKEYCPSSDSSEETQHTFFSVYNEIEFDGADNDSLFIQLENGDYSLNYSRIPKNNSFIIPEYLKEKEDVDIFKSWKYIDFINYFRDQCYSKYYDLL